MARLLVKKYNYCAGQRGFGFGFSARRKAGLTLAQQILAGGVAVLGIAGAQTFTRGTSAWNPATNAITPPGVLRTMGHGLVPTLQAQFALIEGSATNLLAAGSSDTLSLASWSVNRATIVAAQGTAPDGTLTAWKLEETATTGTHNINQSITKAASALPYCIAVSAAQAERRYFRLMAYDSTGTNGVSAYFDLQQGTVNVIATTFGSGFTAGTALIYKDGGMWRCVLPITSNTDTALFADCRGATGGAGSDNYAGTLGSGFLIAWPQIEQSANPTSYVSNRNLIAHSIGGTTGWTQTHCTATANFGTDPLGGTTATRVQYTAGTGAHSSYYSATSAGTITTASQTFTIQCWLKSNTGTNQTVCLDCAQVTIADHFSSNITVTPTWQQFTFTVTNGASAASSQGFAICNGGGTDTSFDVLMWGAQLEFGGTATAMWATDTAPGVRDADNLSVSLASLVDPRTNLLTYSEQFDNAAWVVANGTVAANNATDPNGNSYADTLTATTTAVTIGQAVTVTPGATYTFVWQAKLGTATGPSFAILDATHSTTITSATYAAGAAWGRFAQTFVAPAGCTSVKVQPVSGVSATGTLFLFGAQLVQGSDPGPAGYLPTAGTAVTAAQTGLSTTAGSILAIGIPYGRNNAAAATYLAATGAGTPLEMDVNGQWRRGANAAAGLSIESAGVPALFGITWSTSADVVKSFRNGVQIGSATEGQANCPVATLSTINVGCIAANNGCYGGWVSLFVYPFVVTPQQQAAVCTAAGIH